MPNRIENQPKVSKGEPDRSLILIIGAFIATIVMMAAYQIFSCAHCYGASWL